MVCVIVLQKFHSDRLILTDVGNYRVKIQNTPAYCQENWGLTARQVKEFEEAENGLEGEAAENKEEENAVEAADQSVVKTEVLEVNENCPSKETESEVIELSSDEEDEDDELARCMARVAELKIAKRKREEQAKVEEQAKKIKLELEDNVAANTRENLGRQESLRLYRLRMKALQFPALKPVVRVF